MGFVSNLLAPKMPAMATPPAPPTLSDNAAEIDAAQQAERQRRMAAGRASTVLTGGQGLTTEPPTAAKKLLGA